ncbi:MAG: magnesium transporter [Actinobacteria bacterium QS_5_72_10]|nr:MAG: magnesium transporter [Actinobacteria bacterium QS_5_72_10]
MTELAELTKEQDLQQIRSWLEETGTVDIADELARLPPADRAVVFRLLGKNRALQVFEELDPVHQQELLEGLRDVHVTQLVEAMSPDDRARLLDEVPAKVAKNLQAGLSAEQRAATARLLGYEGESAGRNMTPEYVNLRASMTVADALAKIRRFGANAETIYTLPVTDDQRRLVGIVSLRELVLSPAGQAVGETMSGDPIAASVDDDQEDVARRIQDANLLAMPVVDREDRLVGVITVDDAMEVFEAEVTEDLSRAGGTEPLDKPYFSVSPFTLARKRALWLLILGVAGTLTVSVLDRYESTLESVTALALFVPLLVGAGGNSGAQAASVVIRAMAVGEVRFVDLPHVVGRELLTGLMLGLMLAGVAFVPVWVFLDAAFALVIALTLVAVCAWATLAGATLPMIARRVNIDPAVVSAPSVATLVDATGLIIYFSIALLILPQLD